MRLIYLMAGVLIILVFFLPLSRELEKDCDYSEFEDEEWPR